MKIKFLAVLFLGAICTIAIGCSEVQLLSKSFSETPFDSKAALALWPELSGRLGSYDAQTPQDVLDMANGGMSLLVKSGLSSTSPIQAEMNDKGIRLVDAYPWGLVVAYGCPEYFTERSGSCDIDETRSAQILTLLQNHLFIQRQNPNVVAYWLLDDYPGGEISNLLQKMHELIVASNNDPSSSFRRPAICGFGGRIAPISYKAITPTDAIMSYFEESLTNFRSNYCDMVALYPYAINDGPGPNDQSRYDWSLANTLPVMLSELKRVGWHRESEPLIGMPQAFGYGRYVAPTGSEITIQMESYCSQGAVALLAYSWNDGYAAANPTLTSAEPSTSAEMQTGLARGLRLCEGFWQ